jgi:hypothetical protein
MRNLGASFASLSKLGRIFPGFSFGEHLPEKIQSHKQKVGKVFHPC